ncbi:MAG: hypothetical protein U5N26_02705 [Candidatus Marinimicrobia bacterium]|nr:hypothetical protein [Candidatus Neomarinimicrobiota bacterium]
MSSIMSLLLNTARKKYTNYTGTMSALKIIGDKNDLPDEARKVLKEGEALTERTPC